MTAEDRLRDLYTADPLDHRAIALLEREVWEAHRASSQGKLPKRDHWFLETFGVDPPTHVMFRAGILAHEPWSEPLWSLIGKSSLRRIYGICIDLRLNANRADEVRRLAENPEEAERFKLNGSRGGARSASKTVECSPGDARELRARLREVVKPFVDKRLADLEDPSVAEDIVSALEIEVQAAFTDAMRRIDGLRSHVGAKSVIEIKRRDLRRACEFLGIKLPSRGGAIDMEQARKAHRRLSAQFHPDRTNGNDQMTSQYIEVQRAWEVISAYRA